MADGFALNTDQTFDLWKTTISNYEWSQPNFDYLFERHQYCLLDQLWAKANIDFVPADGGTDIKRQVIYRENGSITFVNPGATRTRATRNVVTEVTVPFIGGYGEYTATRQEIARNIGKSKIKKLIDSRRAAAMIGIAAGLDDASWELPDTSNNKNPWGIEYWLKPITGAQVTAGTSGHQGGNPTGFSDCGGIDASSPDFARWRNYNDVWSNSSGEITEADVEKIATMWRHLHFMAPQVASDIKTPKYAKMKIFADETISKALGRFMRKQRDDLGLDVVAGLTGGLSMNSNGDPVIKGMPIMWAEPLDTADTTNRGANPLYFINCDYLQAVVIDGQFFKEDTPPRDVEQPDVFTTYIDVEGNIVCTNRQLAGGVISYVAAA